MKPLEEGKLAKLVEAAEVGEFGRSELTVLYRGILELPDHYREVVVLCSLQEKSYHDAAAILHCSEGTIASRMNRARKLLAAKLRGSVPGEANTPSI